VRNSAEVVIIGAGIMGAAIAHALAERGVRDIVVVEKDAIARGATADAAGGIRQQFSTDGEREDWDTLYNDVGQFIADHENEPQWDLSVMRGFWDQRTPGAYSDFDDATYADAVDWAFGIYEDNPVTPAPVRPPNVSINSGPAALPLVEQGHVNMVGTRLDAHGQGYYSKLVNFIDQEGTFNWADITGRGSYDLPGSKAAESWLVKKDKESLAAAREALAARMMAGFS
jgi:threonine dehydrogenase-like Zn-dependent dehydrogenase